MRHLKGFALMGIFCLLMVFLLPQTVFAENWWESKQEGSTTDAIDVKSEGDKVTSASRANWEDGYIEVMAGATADMRDTVNLAHAYSVAIKTARHLAYEKLAETVNGINLYSDATYDRELMVDSNLKTVLKAMIRNARVVNEEKKQFTDGSIWVEVTLGLKLFGEDGLVKPSADWGKMNQAKLSPAPEPKPAAPPVKVPPPAAGGAYTGLVIDARGLGASPAMLPKIVVENGEILYGMTEISREYILKYGLMGYQNDLAKAQKLDRVGASPLVVKAVKVSGKHNADYVVSLEDAARIKAASADKNFLKECRVVAVLN